jgi:DNA-binding transcriptional LysR family regulator
MHLSDSGRVWLGYARGILAQVDEAKEALGRAWKLETGEVRIGVIHSFVTNLMPDIAAGFVKRHLGIRLQVHEMSSVEIESQVEAGALDLGFAFHPPARAGVAGERCSTTRSPWRSTRVTRSPPANPSRSQTSPACRWRSSPSGSPRGGCSTPISSAPG